MSAMLTRRRAIQTSMLAAAGLVLLPEFEAFAAQQPGGELVPFDDIPEDFQFRRPGPEESPGANALGIDLREQTTPRTPVNSTYIVSHYGNPAVDAASWRLTVDGNVGRPLTFTLDDLRRRPRVERIVTFECGGNRDAVLHRMISTVAWSGCLLRPILEEAQPARDVLEAIFWGADQGMEMLRGNMLPMKFARSMSLQDAMDAGAILAYEADGQPLSRVHGFPLRLVVPGWYGVANVKWLTRIELSPRRFMGRFMGRDYVTIMGRQVGDEIEYTETSVTRIQLKSVIARVTRPAPGGNMMTVMGMAFGDGTPIERVEVQVDNGPWQPARLEANADPFVWTFWSLQIPALTPGPHTVASRAFDRDGRTQPADLSLKRSNWENNAIWVRRLRV